MLQDLIGLVWRPCTAIDTHKARLLKLEARTKPPLLSWAAYLLFGTILSI